MARELYPAELVAREMRLGRITPQVALEEAERMILLMPTDPWWKALAEKARSVIGESTDVSDGEAE